MLYDKKSLLLAFRIRNDGSLTQVVLYPNVAPLLLPYNGTHVAVGYNGRFALQRPSYMAPWKGHRVRAQSAERENEHRTNR